MKPEFSHFFYKKGTVRWIVGNKAVGLVPLATIRLSKKTKRELLAEKKDYLEAKKIYDDFINVGQKFVSSGERGSVVECKITYINTKTQMVSWKQTRESLFEYNSKYNVSYKAAQGSFLVNDMIALIRGGMLICHE